MRKSLAKQLSPRESGRAVIATTSQTSPLDYRPVLHPPKIDVTGLSICLKRSRLVACRIYAIKLHVLVHIRGSVAAQAFPVWDFDRSRAEERHPLRNPAASSSSTCGSASRFFIRLEG
jgi:hypothetical protein